MAHLEAANHEQKTITDGILGHLTSTYLIEAAIGTAVVGAAILSRGKLASVAEQILPKLALLKNGASLAREFEEAPALETGFKVPASAVESKGAVGITDLGGGFEQRDLEQYLQYSRNKGVVNTGEVLPPGYIRVGEPGDANFSKHLTDFFQSLAHKPGDINERRLDFSIGSRDPLVSPLWLKQAAIRGIEISKAASKE